MLAVTAVYRLVRCSVMDIGKWLIGQMSAALWKGEAAVGRPSRTADGKDVCQSIIHFRDVQNIEARRGRQTRRLRSDAKIDQVDSDHFSQAWLISRATD